MPPLTTRACARLPGAGPDNFLTDLVSIGGDVIEFGEDLLGGGSGAPCLQPIGGPFSVADVAAALRQQPAAADRLRRKMLSFSGWDCLSAFQQVSSTVEGIAQAAVALAHGGQDGEMGPREAEIRNMVQQVLSAASIPSSSTSTTSSGGTPQAGTDEPSDLERLAETILGPLLEGARETRERAEGAVSGAGTGAQLGAQGFPIDMTTILLAGGVVVAVVLATR